MSLEKMLACDYFIAGVSPGLLFNISLNDLIKIVQSENEALHPRTTVEICLIGLVAYFEAFCKNEFASIINICPSLLENFCERRTDVTVSIKDLVTFRIESHNQLGFIIAEKYDFGSAKKINSLYNDLLDIAPFSTKEMHKYDRLLEDRNLLVHHTGVYTSGYAKRKMRRQKINQRIFYDSLIVTDDDFREWSEFLNGIAGKIVHICYERLNEYISTKNIKLPDESSKALGIFHAYNI